MSWGKLDSHSAIVWNDGQLVVHLLPSKEDKKYLAGVSVHFDASAVVRKNKKTGEAFIAVDGLISVSWCAFINDGYDNPYVSIKGEPKYPLLSGDDKLIGLVRRLSLFAYLMSHETGEKNRIWEKNEYDKEPYAEISAELKALASTFAKGR